MTEMAEGWTKVTGKNVVFRQIDTEEMIGEGMTEDMKRYVRSGVFSTVPEYKYFGPNGEEGVQWTLKQVDAELRTWEDFVRDYEPWF